MRHLLTIFALLGAPAAHAQDEPWTVERVRSILAPPAPRELEAIVADWASATDVVPRATVVETGSLERGDHRFDVAVYRYTLNGTTEYSAIFVPEGAGDGTLPMLVETRGVRFDHPPRDIRNGPFVLTMLGELAGRFILVEPCLRGETLRAVDEIHTAGGDRRNAYAGAAEDATHALSVAAANVAAWNGRDVVSFGLSRGGAVALLHGQRDERVTAVVACSAPTDWLALMARPMDDWAQRVATAARSYQGPTDDRAAQFFEWFLQGREALPDRELSRRLLASSALYFAEELPPTIVHQGTLDRAIPSVNAAALSDRFLALGYPREDYQVVFHEGAGHLLRGSTAAARTTAFLKRVLEQRPSRGGGRRR